MKKIVMSTIILMLTAVVTVGQAEVKADSFSFTPFVGGYFFEGNENLKDTAVYGLRAGYNFTKNIGMEGYYSFLQTKIQYQDQTEPWQNISSYGIEGLYHFMPEKRFVPFIAIGLGGIYYSKAFHYEIGSPGEHFESNKFSVDYGAGLKFFLTDNIDLRADVRHILPLNDRYNDLLVTLGINFAFGGEKKIVEAKVEEPLPPPPVAPPVPKVEEPPPPPTPVAPPAPKIEEPPPPPPVAPPVPMEEKVVAKPVIIEKGRQTLNVKFNFDNSTIEKSYYKDINNLVKVMKDYPDLTS